jgi:hypothetical protein
MACKRWEFESSMWVRVTFWRREGEEWRGLMVSVVADVAAKCESRGLRGVRGAGGGRSLLRLNRASPRQSRGQPHSSGTFGTVVTGRLALGDRLCGPWLAALRGFGTFGTVVTGLVSDGTAKRESSWLMVSVVADVSVVSDVADVSVVSDVAAKCESGWLMVSVVADVSVVSDVADVAAKCESGWLRGARGVGGVDGKGRQGASSWQSGQAV